MPPRPSKRSSAARGERTLPDLLPDLLAERGWSQNELARQVGVDATFLSRALRGVRYKSVSGRLAARIAMALDLPPDFFLESRRDYILERLDADPKLLNAAYSWVRRRESKL